eukprot:1159376-Pelagomonas_calceolata.AAC.5
MLTRLVVKITQSMGRNIWLNELLDLPKEVKGSKVNKSRWLAVMMIRTLKELSRMKEKRRKATAHEGEKSLLRWMKEGLRQKWQARMRTHP